MTDVCDLDAMLCRDAEAAPTEEQQPPYLMIDLYPWDLDNPHTPGIDDPNWSRILTNPEIVAVVLKATDGLVYGDAFVKWFRRNFVTLASLFGESRGITRFIGGYHFLQALQDGTQQADFYLRTMRSAGWGDHDIVPIVDVEAGGERHPNRKATRQQWIDNTTKFAERCRSETGRGVMLYGRNVMDELCISSRLGCDRVWDPSYTRTMWTNGLVGKLQNGANAPWTLDDIKWWQCIGDGTGDSYAHHIPLVLPEIGKGVDLSVAIDGPRKPTMARVRAGLL